MFGNIPKVPKVPKDAFDAETWHLKSFEMLEKRCFLQNLKLVDVTPAYKKTDLNLVESYRPVGALPSVFKFLKKLFKNTSQVISMIFYHLFCVV